MTLSSKNRWIRVSATLACANDVNKSGRAEIGDRMALNSIRAEKTDGTCSGAPASDRTVNVANETIVGANVANSTLTALSAASNRKALTSARRAEATSWMHRASQRCSFTACRPSSTASMRRSRSSVAAAVRARSPASACEIRACIGISSSIMARPPKTGGPRARQSIMRAMASCSGADQTMLIDPQAVLMRAQSEEMRLTRNPLSTR
mmetsp:Transcript_26914/g.77547  ORF Transcript_26914/g.77547 Transcript_26914/m.77547 type:complete len:208 (-) Transcript_26914:299-922(-)